MLTREWKPGDRVIHSGRPEWGVGQVTAAQVQAVNGTRTQQLTIRFDRVGVKSLSTGFADLKAAQADERSSGPVAPDAIVEDSEPSAAERLQSLPEEATDPFRPLASRMAATLALYRFTSSGGSLLDWAIAQSGLRDPLSRYSRHELEHAFERFRAQLDQHLRTLAGLMKKQDLAGLQAAAAKAPAPAQQALRRLDALR